MVRLNCSGPG